MSVDTTVAWKTIEAVECRCERVACGYVWVTRVVPARCAKCKGRNWNGSEGVGNGRRSVETVEGKIGVESRRGAKAGKVGDGVSGRRVPGNVGGERQGGNSGGVGPAPGKRTSGESGAVDGGSRKDSGRKREDKGKGGEDIARGEHDPKTCRLYGCGQCKAAGWKDMQRGLR